MKRELQKWSLKEFALIAMEKGSTRLPLASIMYQMCMIALAAMAVGYFLIGMKTLNNILAPSFNLTIKGAFLMTF
ncbi:hypothetical protein ACQKP0_18190 [Heyndrickxia sp. NPDC080065]|uniref:hypothetical protein n=1 Tax=Heyndrickxia sp. NPDC080065 TaxID=3390568 RepID=UPI003D06E5C6